jgi:hypothetical protein
MSRQILIRYVVRIDMAANDFEFAKIERDTFPGKMSTNKKKCCSVVGKKILGAGENYSVCVGINIF